MSIYGNFLHSEAHSGQFCKPVLATYIVNANEWQTFHNTISNGPVCPHIVNGDHVWSKIGRMNDLVHIEAEVRNLGFRYQVVADVAV